MFSPSLYRHVFALRAPAVPTPKRCFGLTPFRRLPRTGRTQPLAAREPSREEIPSFRERLAQSASVKSFTEHVSKPSIRNQVLFFVFGSYLAYTAAAVKTNSDTDHWTRQLSSASTGWLGRVPTSDEMRRAQYFELGRKLQKRVIDLKDSVSNFPETVKNSIVFAYVRLAQPYLDTTEGRRICWTICALNGAVWFAWQLPRLRSAMNVRFMHHPLSGLSYTLITSVFSHKSFLHLLFNCMALASFGSAATHYLSKEQAKNPTNTQEATSKWHFLAFYASAGLFSGLVSHIVSARFRYPRLISQLSANAAANIPSASLKAKNAVSDILPSLGASGAIYAAVTLTALGFPETQIALLIPPSFPIPIQYGVGGLIAIDLLGAYRGWRMFDHYAHLGGAAFGAMYYMYGPQLWDKMRLAYSSPRVASERIK